MKELLIVIGIFLLGKALRCTSIRALRKLGMLCYIGASGTASYFIFDSLTIGILTLIAWPLFPWIELLLSVRKTKLPQHNKLELQQLPNCDHFPNSKSMSHHLLQIGYQHLNNCGWSWDKAKECYSLFWHPQKKHLVSICHRVQPCVSFCYLNITSIGADGTLFRSSNFPFSSFLPQPPETKFNHITSGNVSCPDQVIYDHELFLYQAGEDLDNLNSTDTSQIQSLLEAQVHSQIDHNIKSGLIQETSDTSFRYTFKGLFYLWKQTLKDMIRLC